MELPFKQFMKKYLRDNFWTDENKLQLYSKIIDSFRNLDDLIEDIEDDRQSSFYRVMDVQGNFDGVFSNFDHVADLPHYLVHRLDPHSIEFRPNLGCHWYLEDNQWWHYDPRDH